MATKPLFEEALGRLTALIERRNATPSGMECDAAFVDGCYELLNAMDPEDRQVVIAEFRARPAHER
jgi:hypothetical protein